MPGLSENFVRRYLGGFSRTLLGTVATYGSAYLCLILAARLLGVAEFGRVGAVQSALTAVFAVSVLGIGITATRYVAGSLTVPGRTGRILGLCAVVSLCSGLIFSAFLALLAGTIARDLLRVPDLAWAIRAASPYCTLMTLNAHQTGALLGFEAYGPLMRAQVRQAIANLAFTIPLIWAFGFAGAVLALPLSAGAAWWFARRELSQECRRRGVQVQFRGIWAERAVLAGFTLPASVSALFANAATWAAQAMLIRSSGGVEQMALWTTAAALRQVILFGPGVLNRSAGPILASLHDNDSRSSYTRALWLHILTGSGVAGAAGALILLLQTPLLTAFGAAYAHAAPIIPLAVASALAEAVACSLYQAVFAHAHMRLQLLIGGAWSVVLAGTAGAKVVQAGGRGLAQAYCFAWLASVIGYGAVALFQTCRGKTTRLITLASEAQ